VELACRRAGNAIELEVRDTGTGIDPAFLPYIFDRFRQADSRVTREHGGLGLGLAIARHLVALHGGRIHAHSDGAGRGTTITISLPAAVADAPAAIHPDCEAAGSARHLRELRALVVDDQADSREVIAAMLASAGAVVLQADSAGAALEILSRERVHLLVADIAMPRMDGYELMRRARATYATLRAVAVSAYARPQDSSAALAAGFDAYCAKPVELPALLAAIGSVATAPAP
jgi:CheY-like chemotaxis protein